MRNKKRAGVLTPQTVTGNVFRQDLPEVRVAGFEKRNDIACIIKDRLDLRRKKRRACIDENLIFQFIGKNRALIGSSLPDQGRACGLDRGIVWRG